MVCFALKVIVILTNVLREYLKNLPIDDEEDNDSDDSDRSFHYPTSQTSAARPSSARSHTTDYSLRPSTSRNVTDLTPQLSQAPEFRVPTHESPQKVLTPRMPTPHSIHAQWERDDSVTECRSCNRRFSFLFRKACCHVLLLPRYLANCLSLAACVLQRVLGRFWLS